MRTTADLFTGAARFAAPVLGLELPGVSAPSDDPFAARHALYWLTANLSSERPLALLVDDIHWGDTASLDVLVHVAHRLEGIPVALIVASRPEEPRATLEMLRRHAAAHGTLLGLKPLSEEGAAAVIRRFAPGADDSQCRACHAATGGNPFLLRELARSAVGGDGSLDSERVWSRAPSASRRRSPRGWRGCRRPRCGSPGPSRSSAATFRCDRRPGSPRSTRTRPRGRRRARRGRHPAAARAPHPLEFVHPLVRAAVYAGLGPAGRSRDHARAARLLDLEAGSPERVAAQLLRCQPAGDPWAYERLVAAARLASARGAADAATLYLRRALDEPPPPRSRAASCSTSARPSRAA